MSNRILALVVLAVTTAGVAAAQSRVAAGIAPGRERIALRNATVLAGGEETRAGTGLASILGTEWTVVALGGEPVRLERPPTLRIAGNGALAAFGGCNRFIGQLEVEGTGFSLREGMAGTKMACADPVAAVEDRFLQSLQNVTHHSGDGRMLLLMAEDGTVLIRATAGI